MRLSYKNSLPFRVLIITSVVSLFCSFVITIVQVWLDYKDQISEVSKNLSTISESNRGSLAQALWNYDEEQLENIPKGILTLPSVFHIELVDQQGKIRNFGSQPKKSYLDSKDIKIDEQKVGELRLYSDEDAVRKKVIDRALLLFLSQFIATVFIAIMLLLVIRYQIINHLTNIKSYLLKVNPSKKLEKLKLKRSKIFVDSEDEFSILVSTLNKLQEDIFAYTHNLENLVKDRTEALDISNRNTRAILANINQGILTIGPDLKVGSDYSAQLAKMLGFNKISDQYFSDLILSRCTMSENDKSQIYTCLLAAVEEIEMAFQLNKHILPAELKLTINGNERIIESEWSPIAGSDGNIEKIMLVLKDVTEIRALSEQSKSQQKELEMIGQLLKLGKENFRKFRDKALSELEIAATLSRKNELTQDELQKLFREIHTLKGNARIFGLNYAVNTLHNLEQIYQDLNNLDMDAVKIPFQLSSELEDVKLHIIEYNSLVTKLYGSEIEDTENKENIKSLIKVIDIGINNFENGLILPLNYSTYFKELKEARNRLIQFSLSSILEPICKNAKSEAIKLGKKAPEISVNDQGIRFNNIYYEALQNIFLHLLANSIDHGIETAAERVAKGKKEVGFISISSVVKGDEIIISMFDDGKGLNIKKLHAIGMKRSLLNKNSTPLEIANIIFQAGLSSKEVVGTISGRGFGMNAIKNILKDLGGKINIELFETPKNNSILQDSVSFKFLISLPNHSLS